MTNNQITILKTTLIITSVIVFTAISLTKISNINTEAQRPEIVFNQNEIKQKPYKETFANQLDDYDNFVGFDYTGKFKQIYNQDNQYQQNGSIFISAQKKDTINPMYDNESNDARINTYSADYSGGKLVLKEKFQYGHLQIRAKVPNIAGTLPAFWLINEEPHEGYAEIDIMELPGSEKANAYSSIHWGPNQSNTNNQWGVRNMPTISDRYHWYDLYRFPDRIVVLYDGVKVLEVDPRISQLANGKIPLNDPMSVILNFNIGDKWSGQLEDKQLPAAIEIKELTIRHYR
jgi:beta-glucanase (GH16 family)